MKRPSTKMSPSEPIALIGIGCRYPGGIHDTKSFWELLINRKDGIVEIPSDRWNLKRFYDPEPNKPGKIYVKQGGFIQQPVNAFDALFFGIAPREAECMDPQQRILLETSWEALEDAGIPAESLSGTNTGVFIGAFTLDHQLTQMGSSNRDLIGAHTAIGSTMTILSNRISYFLDLRGPSLSVDTACSSSLVAVHLACQAIWNGESDLAMAGGVNIMTRPEYPVAMCKGGFLAKDGRSKSFDARADGYGRGEGAGVVVLKRLSEAVRDGDPIYAVIRGTGVNQDGHTNGITVPNPESQAALIRSVCNRYQIDPKQIQYIEAHGTGTPVGDPLEAKALGSVIGLGRKADDRCLVGSIKANIGHTEAAAGIAGLIKASLCLSHRLIPPQANLETPNPAIPFESLGLRLPEKVEPLAPDAEQVLACINSFGYGGTNAHVVIENAPPVKPKRNVKTREAAFHVLPLSARSDEALSELARAWVQRISDHDTDTLDDLCYSASCRRSHHTHRLAVTGRSKSEMVDQLQAFVDQGTGEWLAAGQALNQTAVKPVFVFTGMGPQWWGMGRELYRDEPIFQQAVDQCDAIFKKIAGWSILEEMLAEESVSRMSDTTIAQPANFVIQVGLVALWDARGVKPAAIVGHSVGEVTAAYIAGVLSLEDAIKVSYYRSQIQKKASGMGKMLAVGVGEDQCAELLKLTEGKVSIAAMNSPSTITLAGDADSLEAISTYLTTTGEFNRFLQVEVPYHSHYMEALKPEVREKLADLNPSLPELPLYSTVTGDIVNHVAYDAEYWCDNIREPVYFAKALSSILRDGYRVFLEIGPHPVLSTAIKECCRVNNVEPITFASQKRGAPEQRTFELALANLYTAGCEINWSHRYSAHARYLKIPSYPWQREVYWHEAENALADRTGSPAHPLLDKRLSDPHPTWQFQLNHQYLPYLKDHQVDHLVVMPGAAYVEAGLAIHSQLFGNEACVIEQLHFDQALILESNSNQVDPTIHVTFDTETREYAFFSQSHHDLSNWQLHARGKLSLAKAEAISNERIEQIAARCGEGIDVAALYLRLKQRGLEYGPCFQTIQQLQRKGTEILSRIELHASLENNFDTYRIHPTLLDGCFQSLIACLDEDEHFYMPISINRVKCLSPITKQIWCHGRLVEHHEEGIQGDLTLYNDQGQVCVQIEGLLCRALLTQQVDQVEQINKLAYTWEWQPQPLQLANSLRKGTWLVFGREQELTEKLTSALKVNHTNSVIPVDTRYIYQQSHAAIRTLNSDQLGRIKSIVQLAQQQGCVGIAYLWGIQTDIHATDSAVDPVGIEQTCVAMQIMRLLNEVFSENSPRLYFVTQGVQAVTNTDAIDHLAQSPLVGFARVALNEFPGFRCSLIDLENTHVDQQVEKLKTELLANSDEDDVAFRNSERFVHRLMHLEIKSNEEMLSKDEIVNAAQIDAFQFEWGHNPIFREINHSEPIPDDVVEIELQQIDLAGLSADSAKKPSSHRYFAIGTISQLGTAIHDWKIGESVIALCQGMPASRVRVNTSEIFSLTGFRQYAQKDLINLIVSTAPAYYALQHIARVKSGEMILIDADLGDIALFFHGVANGLGVKSVLYSIDDDRLQALKMLPAISVLDARVSDKVAHFLTELDPFLVRAWIHSPSSNLKGTEPLLNTTLQEIIIDESDHQQMPTASSHWGSGLYWSAKQLVELSPQLFNKLLTEIKPFLRKKTIKVTKTVELAGPEFLDYLKEGAGTQLQPSMVLSLRDREHIPVHKIPDRATFIDPAASYLITGGFGGFGLEVANWLAKQGAKHLIMVGRRGAANPEAQRAVKHLEGKGVAIMAAAIDLTDCEEVVNLLSQIEHSMPSLKGIFHGAAILDDAPIMDLTPARIASVMKAKALSAWNLHQLTLDYSLDFFVMCSSVSALIGNSRQANYAAANTVLDMLSLHRKQLGLPSTTINWGAIDTGMAVDSEEVKKHLALMGMNILPARDALECWKFLDEKGFAQFGLMDVNWTRWQEFEPTGGRSLRFSHLANTHSGSESTNSFLKEMSALTPEAQQQRLESLLTDLVAKTLRLPLNKINSQQSLSQMGIDSLMAAELQAAVHQAMGIRVSTLELMRGQNLGQLAQLLADKANFSSVSAEAPVPEHDSSDLIERLSDHDVNVLLNQLLNEKELVNE